MVIGITSQQCLRYFMGIIIMLLAAAGRCCWPLLLAAAAGRCSGRCSGRCCCWPLLLLAAAAAAAVPGWSPAAPTAGPGPPRKPVSTIVVSTIVVKLTLSKL